MGLPYKFIIKTVTTIMYNKSLIFSSSYPTTGFLKNPNILTVQHIVNNGYTLDIKHFSTSNVLFVNNDSEPSEEVSNEKEIANLVYLYKEANKAIELNSKLPDSEKEKNHHLNKLRKDPFVKDYFEDEDPNISDLPEFKHACKERIDFLSADDDDNNGDPGGNGNFSSPSGTGPEGPSRSPSTSCRERVNVNQDPNNSFNSSPNNNSNSNYIEKLSLSSLLYNI